MAKDLIHEAVKEALEHGGWIVTNDPLTIDLIEDDTYLGIDLAATNRIEGEHARKILAIEIKSFVRASTMHAFHEALGQFLNYQAAIHEQGLNYELYLAVSIEGRERLNSSHFIQRRIKQFKLQFILVDIESKELVKWIR